MPNQGKGQWKKRPNQQDGGSGSAANKKRKYFAAGNTAGLPLGSRGFLISCLGGKEQQSAFEASRLLQEVRPTACAVLAHAAACLGGPAANAGMLTTMLAVRLMNG